jgi:hypothetical protein
MLAESRLHVVCYDSCCCLTGWIKLCLSLSSTQRRPWRVSLSSSITHALCSVGQAPEALYLWTLNYVIIWDLGIPDLISRTDFTQLITRHSSARLGKPGSRGAVAAAAEVGEVCARGVLRGHCFSATQVFGINYNGSRNLSVTEVGDRDAALSLRETSHKKIYWGSREQIVEFQWNIGSVA